MVRGVGPPVGNSKEVHMELAVFLAAAVVAVVLVLRPVKSLGVK